MNYQIIRTNYTDCINNTLLDRGVTYKFNELMFEYMVLTEIKSKFATFKLVFINLN